VSFPTDLPKDALTEVLAAFKGDVDVPRLALAVYELAGYALGLYFGDVKFLMGANSKAVDMLNKLMALLTPEDIALYTDVVKFAVTELAAGKGYARIGLDILIKFGPQTLALVVQVINIFKGA